MYSKISKSIVAGMAIALGGWIYLSVSDSIIGAFLFACGLLAVRTYGLNLFTGKTQYMITHEYKWYDYLIFLFGNLCGVMLIAAISMGLTHDIAVPLVQAKISQPIYIALAKGTGCGALMSLATYKKSPLWMCIPCVMAFILAGFNHCIADFYYFCVARNIGWPFIATIIGNICGGILLSYYLNKDEQ